MYKDGKLKKEVLFRGTSEVSWGVLKKQDIRGSSWPDLSKHKSYTWIEFCGHEPVHCRNFFVGPKPKLCKHPAWILTSPTDDQCALDKGKNRGALIFYSPGDTSVHLYSKYF